MNRLPLASALLAAAVTCGTASASVPEDYRFRVLLDGKPIGHHSFSFQAQSEGYRLVSEAQYQVDFLFFTAYKYEHRSEEHWRNDCLARIDADTDDNGETWQVDGSAGEAGYSLSVNGESRQLERECLRTFSYWRVGLLDSGKLLNSQTGELEPVGFEKLGQRALPWDGGGEAASYRLETEQRPIQLWYADDGRWLALESELENGRTLMYRPVSSVGENR